MHLLILLRFPTPELSRVGKHQCLQQMRLEMYTYFFVYFSLKFEQKKTSPVYKIGDHVLVGLREYEKNTLQSYEG